MKRYKTLSALVGLTLIASPFLALAAPGDWRVEYRNSDDTAYVPLQIPAAATTTFRVLGGDSEVGGSDLSKWYYFGNGLNVSPKLSGVPYAGYQISLDPNGINVADLTGTGDIIDSITNLSNATVSTTTYAAGIASLQSQITSSTQVQADYTESSTTAKGFVKNKPSLAAVATSGSYNDLINKPATTSFSFANPTRSLNSGFQVSTTRNAFVSYTVDVSAALSLSGGQTGTVSLQYADDSGFTTNVVTVQSSVNGNTGTLTVGLGLTQVGTAAVTGMIPAGKYVRIVTTNTSGTPTFTYRAAQEVLM